MPRIQRGTYGSAGEIWIKKDTALKPASKEDLDRIYKERLLEEAEIVARRRFSRLREDLVIQIRKHKPASGQRG
jgi:hypothetical protein